MNRRALLMSGACALVAGGAALVAGQVRADVSSAGPGMAGGATGPDTGPAPDDSGHLTSAPSQPAGTNGKTRTVFTCPHCGAPLPIARTAEGAQICTAHSCHG